MISTTFNRYIWLVNTLIQAGRLTYEEISHKWEHSSLGDGNPLPLRTFHMHRRAVEELFQIDILCDASDGYRYYIEDLSSLRKDKTRQWLLNSFSTAHLVTEGKQLKERILLEEIPKGTEYLQSLIDAMKQNLTTEITYQPFYKTESTLYHVCPYCLKAYRQRWYILGYCKELKSIRHFSLDRIQHLNITEKHFDYPSDFSPEAYYTDSIGIWVNPKRLSYAPTAYKATTCAPYPCIIRKKNSARQTYIATLNTIYASLRILSANYWPKATPCR